MTAKPDIKSRDGDSPEGIARAVVEACADCEVCRSMMTDTCLFFDDLYRLYDQAAADGRPLSSEALRRLVDRCHYCALCGCPDIRARIIAAKTRFAERDGLGLGPRLLADVARAGRLCGMFPHLANRVLANERAGRLFKRLADIHPARRLPIFPEKGFDSWARCRGLTRKPASGEAPRVAYFAGCSGRFLFPEVPRAMVAVLQQAGVDVFYPEQQCCGMPTLLEGDRRKTLAFMETNVARLAALAAEGFTIVCSCPTCGFVFKKLLKERAYHTDAYQRSIGAPPGILKIPVQGQSSGGAEPVYTHIPKSLCGAMIEDSGYFAAIDPLQRVAVAEHTRDAGEYLAACLPAWRPQGGLKAPKGRDVYFAPCHQREQNAGRPYLSLLQQFRNADMAVVDGPYDCCGMGGIMGYKQGFHESSMRLAAPLMAKIVALEPTRIITECLSCRLQFMCLTDIPVVHPLEVIATHPGGSI
jgi:glycerol-3-phosphate dehydrogenase subunit C